MIMHCVQCILKILRAIVFGGSVHNKVLLGDAFTINTSKHVPFQICKSLADLHNSSHIVLSPVLIQARPYAWGEPCIVRCAAS